QPARLFTSVNSLAAHCTSASKAKIWVTTRPDAQNSPSHEYNHIGQPVYERKHPAKQGDLATCQCRFPDFRRHAFGDFSHSLNLDFPASCCGFHRFPLTGNHPDFRNFRPGWKSKWEIQKVNRSHLTHGAGDLPSQIAGPQGTASPAGSSSLRYRITRWLF